MKNLRRYTIIILCVVGWNYTNAQSGESKHLWNIEACFKYAAEHNIQVSTLRLNEQSSLFDLSAARAERIPSLAASLSNTLNNANNSVGANGKLVSQLTSVGAYGVNSSIVLWNGGAITNNIRQHELISQSAELLVQQSLNNVTLLITGAYLEILLSKETLQYVSDLVSASESKVKQGRQFYDAGSIAKKDLLQLQAQLEGDKYLLVQTKNEIRQNILSLKQILQLPPDTSFDIVIPDSVSVPLSLPSLDEVREAALSDFPETKIGKLAINVASSNIAIAKAGFKPTLSATGSLGTGYYHVVTNSVSPKTDYFTQTGNNFYQQIGLKLSVPIFSNRINKTNLEKAVINYKQAHLDLQNDQLILSQAVEQAYLSATNAIQSYEAAEKQLEAVTESYRIVNEQFKLGATNIYEQQQQRNQYVQAVQAFTQAKYNALLQQKIYEFYKGKSVTL